MKIAPRTADTLSEWAQEFYNPDLPYHNWGHAEEVATESLAILNQGGRWTRAVNRPLLQIAGAWHDAGHDDSERHTFPSPEHYSAHLMRQRLKGELPERQLAEIEESILGTRFKKPRHTMAAIALHYGDVGNMAHEWGSFFDHTSRLWEEYGSPDWKNWRHTALQVIGRTAHEATLELPRIGITDRTYVDAIYANSKRLGSYEDPRCV